MNARSARHLAQVASLALVPAAMALAGPEAIAGVREGLAASDMRGALAIVALVSCAVSLPLGAGAAGKAHRARSRRRWRERDVRGELAAIAHPWRVGGGP
jgi:hypothetical protein